MTHLEIDIKLRQVYQNLKVEFNIPFKYHLHIVISKRLRSCNGHCKTTMNRVTKEVHYAQITMSQALLEEFGWETFEKTFRHEVAHITNRICGGNNHDNSFRRLCEQYGGSMAPSKAMSQFSNCTTQHFVEVIIKWIYTCPCGYQKKMAKRMSRKKRGNPRYRCGSCRIHTLDKWTEQQVE